MEATVSCPSGAGCGPHLRSPLRTVPAWRKCQGTRLHTAPWRQPHRVGVQWLPWTPGPLASLQDDSEDCPGLQSPCEMYEVFGRTRSLSSLLLCFPHLFTGAVVPVHTPSQLPPPPRHSLRLPVCLSAKNLRQPPTHTHTQLCLKRSLVQTF